ncbi:MAG: methyltransferase [Casimicrobiaceae bacterium]
MSAAGTDGAGPSKEQESLLRMVYGAQGAQVIYVAAKLGLADCIASGTQHSAGLAQSAGIDEPTAQRLLRGLASLGICEEVETGRFALTGMGQYLRADHPQSLQARVLFNSEVLWPVWGAMLETVRSGNAGAMQVFGMPFYDYLQAQPESGRLFDRTMADAIRYRVEPALAAYDFSRFRKVVDIGGGNGTLVRTILQRWPHLEGVVFDLPSVAQRAGREIGDGALDARYAVQAGNALERVPEGADCYVMSNFIVSLADDDAATILRNCRQAMAGDGTVVIIEWIMPTPGESAAPFTRWDAASMDLNMLAIHGRGGWRVRTSDEFRRLLQQAGFVLSRIIPTRSSVSVLECVAG